MKLAIPCAVRRGRGPGRLARLTLVVLALAVGCGGRSSSPARDLSVPPIDQDAPIDQEAPADFFVGRYSCLQTLDQYCATAADACLLDLASALAGDGGCDQPGRMRTCGDDVIVEYLGTSGAGASRLTTVYSAATQQLVAVLVGDGDFQTACLAGPPIYANPALLSCPLDAGTAQLFCAPKSFPPPCGPLARKCS